MGKNRGWKFGAIATAGTLTVVTATLAGVGAIALNVLPTKPRDLANKQELNYVALGDGLTSGANMVIGEDYVSFADFFASDLKNANKLGSYENFADSSNKIFDVLNGALMNGAQREAIKKADIITITAGTNDLLALMELFGVPLVDLKVEEETDRGGLNDVTSLENQYAERQNKVVDVLESLGNAIDRKDFTGAISIDENVFNDLFLAVNLNLTLLTTEIAKIAPGAKIVLISPFNPVENLPKSLTDAPLGNGGMSFNQLFSKLIKTYDTVAKLNPACEHINMNDIDLYRNDVEKITLFSSNYSSYELNKNLKRFNDLDVNPSSYGHRLIGNGLFSALSDDLGVSNPENFYTDTRNDDGDGIAQYTLNGKFQPELIDAVHTTENDQIYAAFTLAEQILEPLRSFKYGENANARFEVVQSLNASGETIGTLRTKQDSFEWMDNTSLKNMLISQMKTDSPISSMMRNLLTIFTANSVDENERLYDALQGELKLSSDANMNAHALLNGLVGEEFNGTETEINIDHKIDVTYGTEPNSQVPHVIRSYMPGQIVNINEEFGVSNISQLYGLLYLSDVVGTISASWDQFFVNIFSWQKIANGAGSTTPNPNSGLLPKTYIFAYTSPLYIFLHEGTDEFINRLTEMGLSEKVDLPVLRQQLDSWKNSSVNTSNDPITPSFTKNLFIDMFNVSYNGERMDASNVSDWDAMANAYILDHNNKYYEIAKLIVTFKDASTKLKEIMFS